MVTVQKLFLENEEPVIFTENQIPALLLTEPYRRKDWKKPVYQFISDYGRQRLSYYLSEIIPIKSSARLATILNIEKEVPLISFSEIGYNDENEPILRACSCLRDDLLRLRLIRRKAA